MSKRHACTRDMCSEINVVYKHNHRFKKFRDEGDLGCYLGGHEKTRDLPHSY